MPLIEEPSESVQETGRNLVETQTSVKGSRETQRPMRIDHSPTEKYVQSGCWNTSALTLASGSIIIPSVKCTPIASGRSSIQMPAWSSRVGHAGYPKLYRFPR